MNNKISIAAALLVLGFLSVLAISGTPLTSADSAGEEPLQQEAQPNYETCGGPGGCVSGCACGCGGSPTLCGCGR